MHFFFGLCVAGERAQLLQDKARLASVQIPGSTTGPVNLLTLYFRVQGSRASANALADTCSGTRDALGAQPAIASRGHGDIEWLHLLDPEVTGGSLEAFGMAEAFDDLVAASIVQPLHSRRKVRARASA